MRRIICFALLCLFALPVACSNQPVVEEDEKLAKEGFKDWLQEALRDDPDLVLDVLREQNQTLFQIVDAGYREYQAAALVKQRLAQLASGQKPVIDPDRPMMGVDNATITIVEFSDFQCPYCSQAARTVELLMKKYEGRIRKIYKHMPLSSHDHAHSAAAIFEAAAMQDKAKAWELYYRYFQDQDAIQEGGVQWLMQQAQEVGLDLERINQDAGSEAVLNRIKADLEEAKKFGLQGTPSFIINGVTASGAMSLEEFSEIVEFTLEELPKIEAEKAEAAAAAEANGTAAQ